MQYALGRNLSPHDDALRLPIFPILLPEGDLHNLPPFLSLFQVQHWQAGEAVPEKLINAIRDKTELLDDSNTFTGCPFLGLSAFQPEHANLFFGRREETLDALKLLGTLYRQRLCERYLLPTGLDVSAVTTAMLNDAKFF